MKAIDLLNRVLEKADVENQFEPDPRGKVRLKLEEGAKPYLLRIDFGQLADADKLTGRAVMHEVQSLHLHFDTLRALFFVGVQPDGRVKSLHDVNRIITMRNHERVELAVMTAVWANLPDVEEEEANRMLESVGIEADEAGIIGTEEPEGKG